MNPLVDEPASLEHAQNGSFGRISREAIRINVRGQVQGIGFRPFVYRLAQEFRLGGSVRNAPSGVVIEAEGMREALAEFLGRITADAPASAVFDDVVSEAIALSDRFAFRVEPSDPHAPPQARVPRDVATCEECRRDIVDPESRRRGYPFTSCTACGPRYSILEAMPYDRASTAMHVFGLCANCHDEFHSAEDRRFHAQANACAACGPHVALWDVEGRTVAECANAVASAAELLRSGLVVAIKGLGGFQLMVRADNAEAVRRLRMRKQRPSKPLAVMVASLEVAEQLVLLGPFERQLLLSPQNPIVLIGKRPSAAGTAADGNLDVEISAEVAPRINLLGLLLPTTPLHHLLLDAVGVPLVATSGNRSEESIVTDEHEATSRLAGIADAFLVHDRPIARGIDDSVVRVVAGQPVTIRLARGLAPLPLPALEAFAEANGCPPMLATGGHMKNAIAVWTGKQAVLAQHVGDLDCAETRSTFDKVAHDLCALFQFEPAHLACDLHPDYFTTRWAMQKQLPLTQVQHHHAHALSCMVEHNLLDRKVLALAWDGTGFGIDATIWGGEILRVSSRSCERAASLLPFPLPGGEQAIRHPARIAFGLCWLLRGEEAAMNDRRLLELLGLSTRETEMLAAMLRRGVNAPWTSSMGRLFDAVAALVLGARAASYEGELAERLEAAADPAVTEAYDLRSLMIEEQGAQAGDRTIARADWRPMLAAILIDLSAGVSASTIAARFHNALAGWAAQVAASQPLGEVVLSGGCWQNRLLAERTVLALASVGRQAYLHSQIPPGDGGLAVGQLAAALAHWTGKPSH